MGRGGDAGAPDKTNYIPFADEISRFDLYFMEVTIGGCKTEVVNKYDHIAHAALAVHGRPFHDPVGSGVNRVPACGTQIDPAMKRPGPVNRVNSCAIRTCDHTRVNRKPAGYGVEHDPLLERRLGSCINPFDNGQFRIGPQTDKGFNMVEFLTEQVDVMGNGHGQPDFFLHQHFPLMTQLLFEKGQCMKLSVQVGYFTGKKINEQKTAKRNQWQGH